MQASLLGAEAQIILNYLDVEGGGGGGELLYCFDSVLSKLIYWKL